MKPIIFIKSHVSGYTKRDGTVVSPYSNKRVGKPSQTFGKVASLAIRAHDSLSSQAKNAVDSWNINWTSGELERAFQKDSAIAAEIRQAFKPVREKLRAIYGDTISLYRGERHSDEVSSDSRKLFSWSPVKELADSFASNGRVTKKYGATEEEIKQAVETYNKTGFVTFRGRKYKRNKEMPDYYDIYNKHNHIITDGDDLEAELRGDQNDRDENVADGRSKGHTFRADVPVDSLVWIPVGANLSQPEFIATYNPRKQTSEVMAKSHMVLFFYR